jgi:hypothetical protein
MPSYKEGRASSTELVRRPPRRTQHRQKTGKGQANHRSPQRETRPRAGRDMGPPRSPPSSCPGAAATLLLLLVASFFGMCPAAFRLASFL